MDIFYSILAGIIQGLTEFLPVSSSGHLVFFHYFSGFDFVDDLSFDVVLHLGTLVALVIFFFSDILKYFLAFGRSFVKWDLRSDFNQRLAWYLLVATIPALVIGYFFDNAVDSMFRSPVSVAWVLIIFGLVLYLADKYLLKIRILNQLTWPSVLIIGFLQTLAFIPGVSRSGITIVAGLTQKLKRHEAARFSFLMAIPAVFAAGAKKSLDLYQSQAVNSANFLVLIVGFLASAVVGYLCIKYFLKFLESHSLKFFAFYRIILGVLVLAYLAYL